MTYPSSTKALRRKSTYVLPSAGCSKSGTSYFPAKSQSRRFSSSRSAICGTLFAIASLRLRGGFLARYAVETIGVVLNDSRGRYASLRKVDVVEAVNCGATDPLGRLVTHLDHTQFIFLAVLKVHAHHVHARRLFVRLPYRIVQAPIASETSTREKALVKPGRPKLGVRLVPPAQVTHRPFGACVWVITEQTRVLVRGCTVDKSIKRRLNRVVQ